MKMLSRRLIEAAGMCGPDATRISELRGREPENCPEGLRIGDNAKDKGNAGCREKTVRWQIRPQFGLYVAKMHRPPSGYWGDDGLSVGSVPSTSAAMCGCYDAKLTQRHMLQQTIRKWSRIRNPILRGFGLAIWQGLLVDLGIVTLFTVLWIFIEGTAA
eukprot:gene20988-21739_t